MGPRHSLHGQCTGQEDAYPGGAVGALVRAQQGEGVTTAAEPQGFDLFSLKHA